MENLNLVSDICLLLNKTGLQPASRHVEQVALFKVVRVDAKSFGAYAAQTGSAVPFVGFGNHLEAKTDMHN